MSWNNGIESADAIFQQRLAASPDRARSSKEWKLARENFLVDSILRRFLTGKGAQAHTEFPFLWSIDNHACVEGIIDLLGIDNARGKCLLVDWKTNQIKKGEEEQLRKRYQPQLAAYWKSISEITRFEVEAAIFATATGQFVAYNADELEKEWTRLRALPADQLVAVAASLQDA
jgi:ATP-dependent exoDNAse (exonuclease V) beta subunit